MAVDYNVTEVDGSPSEPSHEKEKKGEKTKSKKQDE